MNRRSTAELAVEDQVAQDYQRFLNEADQLLQAAKQLTGDSATLVRHKLEDRVAQAKVGLEGLRRSAAERSTSEPSEGPTNKLLWGAGLAVTGLAIAAYVYARRS